MTFDWSNGCCVYLAKMGSKQSTYGQAVGQYV